MNIKNMLVKSSVTLVSSFLLLALVGFKGCDWVKDKMSCSSCGNHSHAPAHASKSPAQDAHHGLDSAANKGERDVCQDSGGFLVAVEDGSKVLVRLKNGCMVTENSLDKRFKKMESLGVPVSRLSKDQRLSLLWDMLKLQLVVMDYGDQLNSSSDFQQDLAERSHQLYQALVMDYYGRQLRSQVVITDQEAALELQQNSANYLLRAGGTSVAGITFGDRQAAEEFKLQFMAAQEVAGAPLSMREFERFVQEQQKGGLHRFGRLNVGETHQGVPVGLAEFASAVDVYPSVEVWASQDMPDRFWVLLFADRQEPQYSSLEDVKRALSEVRIREAYTLAMEQLEQDWVTGVDPDCIQGSTEEDDMLKFMDDFQGDGEDLDSASAA